jgi:hypothetical protein
MIIRFPTGSYRDVLPSVESDSTSVTYLISNTIPPRSSLTFPKIPATIAARPTKQKPLIQKPSDYGTLSITVNRQTSSKVLSGAKTFDVGQILEFTDSNPFVVDPMLVTPNVEARHDTNLYDLTAVGLTTTDQTVLVGEIQKAQAVIREALNRAIQDRANAETDIANIQKVINEATKSKQAAEIAVGNLTDKTAINQIIEKLTQTIIVKNAELAIAIDTANTAAANSNDLRQQYLALSKLVN